MKILVALLLLTASALASASMADGLTRQQVAAQIRDLVKQQQTELDSAKIATDVLRLENQSLGQDIAAAKADKAALDAAIARLQNWGVDQLNLKNDAMLATARAEKALAEERTAHQATLDRYHRFKLAGSAIVGGLLGLAGLFIGFKLAQILSLFGPRAWISPLIAAVLGASGGFSFIWLFF